MPEYALRLEGRAAVRVSDTLQCNRCRDVLYPGDDYYSMNDECICEDCMDAVLRRMRRTVGE